MRRQKYFWLFLPCIITLLALSLPQEVNQKIRNMIGEKVSRLRFKKSQGEYDSTQSASTSQEVQTQELIDWHNKQELERAKNLQETEMLVPFQIHKNSSKDLDPAPSFLLAKVVFRASNTWNNSLWIDVGEEDNPELGVKIIEKNSPVLSGDSVIGVIDYVGKKSSLVRLITDPGFCPSVRVCRTRSNFKTSLSEVKTLYQDVENNSPLFKSAEEKKVFLFLMNELMQSMPQETEIDFLAKGELHGHGEPLWRSAGIYLKGIGFNYDFCDKEGPARDLRTGEVIDPNNEYTERPKMSIIQVGDLLVTSGLDGIFPEGLKIAKVSSISPLKEGDFTYTILAKPTASDILNVQYVSVLPPQKYSQEEIPDRPELIMQLIDQDL